MQCLTLQRVLNILTAELLDNFKSVCVKSGLSSLHLKGFRVVTFQILCVWWYIDVTYKMFHGHCWSHYRRWSWFKVGLGVKNFGFILNTFYRAFLSSEDS